MQASYQLTLSARTRYFTASTLTLTSAGYRTPLAWRDCAGAEGAIVVRVGGASFGKNAP